GRQSGGASTWRGFSHSGHPVSSAPMTAEAVAVAPHDRAQPRALPWCMIATVPLLMAALAFAWTLHGERQRTYGRTSQAWHPAYDQEVIYNGSLGQGVY